MRFHVPVVVRHADRETVAAVVVRVRCVRPFACPCDNARCAVDGRSGHGEVRGCETVSRVCKRQRPGDRTAVLQTRPAGVSAERPGIIHLSHCKRDHLRFHVSVVIRHADRETVAAVVVRVRRVRPNACPRDNARRPVAGRCGHREVRSRETVRRVRKRQRPGDRTVILQPRPAGVATERARVVYLRHRERDHLRFHVPVVVRHADRETVAAVVVRVRCVRPNACPRDNAHRAVARRSGHRKVRTRETVRRVRKRQRPGDRTAILQPRPAGVPAERPGIIHLRHRDIHCGRGRSAITVAYRVAERVATVEVGRRRVRDRAVRVDRRRTCRRNHRQRVTVHVTIVGQYGDGDRRVLVGGSSIVQGHRWVVAEVWHFGKSNKSHLASCAEVRAGVKIGVRQQDVSDTASSDQPSVGTQIDVCQWTVRCTDQRLDQHSICIVVVDVPEPSRAVDVPGCVHRDTAIVPGGKGNRTERRQRLWIVNTDR